MAATAWRCPARSAAPHAISCHPTLASLEVGYPAHYCYLRPVRRTGPSHLHSYTPLLSSPHAGVGTPLRQPNSGIPRETVNCFTVGLEPP